MSNKNTLIGVTNELIQNYDRNFNENYNKIVTADSTIQNKEQLIIKENEILMTKEKNILILKNSIFLVIILCILFLLYTLGKLDFNKFIGLSIVSIIVFTIYIYYNVISYFNLYNVGKRIQGIKVAMKDYAKKVLEDTVPNYECPSTCNRIPEEESPEPEEEYNYLSEPGDTLRTDPQLNVWKLGGLPYNQNPKTMKEINKLIKDGDVKATFEPKQTFGTTYPKSTYYECKWLGGGKRNEFGLPLGTPLPEKKYSPIPCSYKPNMTEISRYICKEDPNGNVGLNEGNNCINISK